MKWGVSFISFFFTVRHRKAKPGIHTEATGRREHHDGRRSQRVLDREGQHPVVEAPKVGGVRRSVDDKVELVHVNRVGADVYELERLLLQLLVLLYEPVYGLVSCGGTMMHLCCTEGRKEQTGRMNE